MRALPRTPGLRSTPALPPPHPFVFGAQVAWAQLQVLAQLALLLQYVLWSQSLANWSLTPDDGQQLEGTLLPRALQLLHAAGVAYWAAVTPVVEGAAGEGGAAALDPSQLVVNLRIGDGPPAGTLAG